MPHLKDLIEGSNLNDKKCREMIYKSFYGYLLAVILRYVNERDDAQELVNDSFIKIYKGLTKFTSDENGERFEKAARGWMARIASRTAIDFLRKNKTMTSLDALTDAQLPVMADTAMAQLNARDILRLLNCLPSMHKIVFNLYEIEGYAHEEIAKMLNIPESSSRVYLTRAKQKLREVYIKNLNATYEIK